MKKSRYQCRDCQHKYEDYIGDSCPECGSADLIMIGYATNDEGADAEQKLQKILEWVEEQEENAYTEAEAADRDKANYYDGYIEAWTEVARKLDREIRAGDTETD